MAEDISTSEKSTSLFVLLFGRVFRSNNESLNFWRVIFGIRNYSAVTINFIKNRGTWLFYFIFIVMFFPTPNSELFFNKLSYSPKTSESFKRYSALLPRNSPVFVLTALGENIVSRSSYSYQCTIGAFLVT